MIHTDFEIGYECYLVDYKRKSIDGPFRIAGIVAHVNRSRVSVKYALEKHKGLFDEVDLCSTFREAEMRLDYDRTMRKRGERP